MGIKEIAVGRKDIFLLDPRTLVEEDGFNARQETPELIAYIEDLAGYIYNNGVPGILDVYAKGEQIVVVDGHCRRRASIIAMDKGAELKGVPCRVLDRYLNDIDRTARLITANQGRPLTSLEEAEVIKRLRAFGMENKDIAAKLGWSRGKASNLLILGSVAPEVRAMVKENKISATMAVEETRKDPAQAPQRLKEAVERAEGDGKPKATRKYTLAPKKDDLDGIKKIIRTLSNESFENLNDWMAEEVERRGEV